MTRFRDLWRDSSAASGAEFALVLPILLLLLFGIIDAGRFMWEFNRAEKATQMGVRYAAVTNSILGSGFYDYSFSINDGIPQGSSVPTDEFNNVTCTEGSCDCVGGGVCDEVAYNDAAFQAVVDRMSAMYPAIDADNVIVTYRNVGLGYAGDPNGPDVAPLVTVKLQDLEFQPLTCLIFACSIGMPDFRASVTGEDLSGSISH